MLISEHLGHRISIMESYDLLVIGGGINGVGIARDAAGRGLRVLLCEKDDLASHTSSWSTKLIHGGLRYLEHREFRLVRESLIEREVLLNAAPHMVKPLRFVLPHHDGLRPAWMLRLGLFLYDHIGGRKLLAATTRVDLKTGPLGAPLADRFTSGFEYTDCQVDDSRLVVLNAMDAAARGAVIRTRTKLVRAERRADQWHATLSDPAGNTDVLAAKAVVNAAGPWVTDVLGHVAGVKARKTLRLVKGSHILTKRLYDHDRAYIFQNADGRIIFAIPYVNDTTLIGTTDEAFEGDPQTAEISQDEIDYLCRSVSEYLAQAVTPDMIVGTFSGVRPRYDELGKEDASAVTRDYAFDIEHEGGAPILSVYGGKLTTYRKLAEHALEQLSAFFPSMTPAWTRSAALPGGAGGYCVWAERAPELKARYSFLGEETMDRMLRAHGENVAVFLGEAEHETALGHHFGHGLYAAEIDYMLEKEFALSAEDILNRRTKLGAVMTDEQRAVVQRYIDERLGIRPRAA
ncbi:MAG: glycerol-3-phosphate dehydrogenase [Pseudomonadota bacterium]